MGLYPPTRLVTDLCSASRKLDQYNMLLILFTCNFIGMTFSRGTHQQFYSWYSYSFPFLVDAAFGPGDVDECHSEKLYGSPLSKFAIIVLLEIVWSVPKPRTPLQSYGLCAAHAIVLLALLFKASSLEKFQKKAQ